MNETEEIVRNFYDSYGWVKKGGVSGEDTQYRDFLPAYYPYHNRVNSRTIECFAGLNGRLLIAGGGDLPDIHVTIASEFSELTFLDISKAAIDIARSKLESRGEFILGSILDIPKPENYFDASYCAHVIYHIDKDRQAKAIRELIRVIKPGGRVIVIYRNPNSLPIWIAGALKRLPSLRKLKAKLRRKKAHSKTDAKSPPPLYFFAHPISWWAQFKDECNVEIRPWDVMGNAEEKIVLFNNPIASVGYRVCSWVENRNPSLAARWWSYPIVILTKKTTR